MPSGKLMGTGLLLLWLAGVGATSGARAAIVRNDTARLEWSLNYSHAMYLAERQHRMVFIYFYEPKVMAGNSIQTAFEQDVLTDPGVRRRLANYVLLLLPIDARIYVNGKLTKVLEHEAFSDMRSLPGIAIVDMKHSRHLFFRQVVSAFPFDSNHNYGAAQLKAILALPRGTLTQRTLIYAVWVHPERPGSADGQQHPVLEAAATQHAQYMADVQVQGHQDWERRFHELESQLPEGLEPTEVAAESWPDQTLVDAAIECVYDWRQSPGHWEAVSDHPPFYGYDMKLGRNRIWYATGIFARRR